ncbi:hypothetical protein CI1B_47820 [Bradyrhizobium ivorense]|uniref:Uncharacterized protein n=1 Tax=Bradyrhizobium ivorense TaxID=2511166 RepID=A0A508TGD6_9BRAD|nr:hypothetical protein [Bradyrhizobium ivorense]MCC8937510.1 hypothetical protein [Bradyrhizobium ivorense]VIO73178.1 hypothetical protein CI1B_47820 [Bradyrhizobium ivorense]
MSEDLLRQVVVELNQAPEAANRTARATALVTDVNTRIATEALRAMPFDTSPYAYQAWLAQADRS